MSTHHLTFDDLMQSKSKEWNETQKEMATQLKNMSRTELIESFVDQYHQLEREVDHLRDENEIQSSLIESLRERFKYFHYYRNGYFKLKNKFLSLDEKIKSKKIEKLKEQLKFSLANDEEIDDEGNPTKCQCCHKTTKTYELKGKRSDIWYYCEECAKPGEIESGYLNED